MVGERYNMQSDFFNYTHYIDISYSSQIIYPRNSEDMVDNQFKVLEHSKMLSTNQVFLTVKKVNHVFNSRFKILLRVR